MDFSHWLQQQLDQRGWLQAELVNRAKQKGLRLTSAQVSRVLNREQKAGIKTCLAIAEALDIPREEVFRARGWLLPLPENQVITRLTELAQQLPKEDRLILVRVAEGLARTPREKQVT